MFRWVSVTHILGAEGLLKQNKQKTMNTRKIGLGEEKSFYIFFSSLLSLLFHLHSSGYKFILQECGEL